MPQGWSKERVPDELRDYLETVFDAYENIWQDWPTEYRQIGQQGVAEGTQLSPNMSVSPNQDPNSPEEWDYHYKGQQIKPDDKFHPQIKDLHLRQIDPTYDAFRNAFDNPLKPGPAVPQQPPQGDTIIPSRPAPPEKIKGPDGKPLKLKDIMQQDPPLSEGNSPGKTVVDAILKVIPVAQEIWFHGSRATGKHRRNSDTDILVIVPDDLVGDQYLGVVRILQKLSTHFDNHDIQPARPGSNIHRVSQEEGRLLWSNRQDVEENFADGRHPEDKGDSKRHGINTKASVSSLRKTAKQGGRKGQLAHWLANMKAGRAKKKTNETVIGNLHFPQLTIAVDDHAIDRTRTRGIDPHTIDQSLRKLNAVANQLAQIEPNAQVWAYDAENNLGLGLRRISSRDMLFKLKTVVADRPFDGAIPIIELS
jgi:predicted nucleotidyltransferase